MKTLHINKKLVAILMICLLSVFSVFVGHSVAAQENTDESQTVQPVEVEEIEGEEGYQTPMAIMGELDLDEEGEEIEPIIAVEGGQDFERNPLARGAENVSERNYKMFLLVGISTALLVLGTFIVVIFRKNAVKERI